MNGEYVHRHAHAGLGTNETLPDSSRTRLCPHTVHAVDQAETESSLLAAPDAWADCCSCP